MQTQNGGLRPRWSKVLADLWENRGRTALVVASIAVGVFAIGTILNAYLLLSQDLPASYANVAPANISIVTDPFETDLTKSIETVPGVDQVEGRQTFNVTVIQDGEPWQNLELLAAEDFANSSLNQLEPREGNPYPGENELVIGFEPMRDSGFRLGDVLRIQLADGTLRELPVVGIVTDQTAFGDFNASTRGYISAETLEWLGQPELYNRLYATVSENPNDEAAIEAVAGAVEDKLEKSGRGVYRTQINKSNEHPFIDLALAIFGVLGALGVLVVLLSSSLIVNTLNALINQQLRQIGVMKLIGARSMQILGMYLLLILTIGFIALLIAVPLAAGAGYGLAQLMAYLMKSTLQGFRFFPLTILVQALIAVIVPVAVGFVPVNSGSKIKVRRAISNDRPGDQTGAGGVWDRLGNLMQWISRPILLSLRNTFRRKGRLALTLFTLAVSGAIFIAVFNVRVSMQDFLKQIQQHFIADITLNFEQPYRVSKVEGVLYQIPGIEAVEAWSGAVGEILDPNGEVLENLQVLAPPADTALLEPEMVAGRWLTPEDERAIVISDAIWDTLPGIQPGDKLSLKVSGEREAEWVLVGIFRFSSFIGDPLSYAPYQTISDVQNMANQSASFRIVTREQTPAEQQLTSTQVDQVLRDRGYRISDIQTGAEAAEQSTQMIDILILFLLTMALLTAIVGSIGLMGTMGMNVLDRTREIGVMRAIGAVDLAIVKSVVIEGAFIGLLSWVLGVIASFPISYLLLKIISESLINAPIALTFTLDGILIWLAVVLALAVFASVLPARNAARLTIREVLAYE